MKLREVADMSKDELVACLMNCKEFIGSQNTGEAHDIKLSEYIDALKKRAIKFELCPECLGDMVWNYSVDKTKASVIGFLKCVKCKHKEVI